MKKRTIHVNDAPVNLQAVLYQEELIPMKGVLLYFHGGGLLFGYKEDLPAYHIETLCENGYGILAFDYRLSPASSVDEIMEDVIRCINWYLDNCTTLFGKQLPYFLWGRSAGAYLCLMAGNKTFSQRPAGIISYYGYAFLVDDWFNTPAPYYQTLPLPETDILSDTEKSALCVKALPEQRYILYAKARQTGSWVRQFFNGREKDFYLNYTLRSAKDFSQYPPVFLTHSFHDPDVPYQESQRLAELLPRTQFHPVSGETHDFDRDADTWFVRDIIHKTVCFLDNHI